jgi:nucleoside-diphosphate-sugar epimerase
VIVRPERSAEVSVVGVTGAAAGLGGALVRRLAGTPDLALVALDEAVPDDLPPRVEGRPLALLGAGSDGAASAAALAGLDVLVHLATSYDVGLDAAARRTLNVRGTAAVLERARLAGVRRVVLVTSTEVYGARPDNPVPLPEDAPLRAEHDGLTLTGDHVEVERLAAHARLTGLEVTVLRPATLVGGPLGPGYDGQQLRRLAGQRLLATRGHEPLWQLCHTDDLLAALELAARETVTGALAVASPGWVEQSRVEVLAGKRRLELPPAVALSTAARLHQFGVVSSSRRELDTVLAPLVLHPAALLHAGWVPGWSNDAALLAHLAGRGPDGRGAVGAAAGATVAVVGAAALVRARRRRRRR